VLGNSTTKIK
jgi:hypothetical protein